MAANLPTDEWMQVFQHLTPDEFINRCLVDKTFATTCESEEIWRRKFEQDFGNRTPASFIDLSLGTDTLRIMRPLNKEYAEQIKSTLTWRQKYIGYVGFNTKYRIINGDIVVDIIIPDPGIYLAMRNDTFFQLPDAKTVVNSPKEKLNTIKLINMYIGSGDFFKDLLGIIVPRIAISYDDYRANKPYFIWICGMFNGLTVRMVEKGYRWVADDIQECPKGGKTIHVVMGNP